MTSHRFQTVRAATGLLLAFLQVASATAGTIEFTETGRNARSSLNFRGESNVLATVPKGTEGDVLESYKLPSGNYGIKLKIKKLGAGRTSLKADEEIWVYFNKDHSPYIALLDDKGRSAKNPEDGTWAVVTKSFRTQRSVTKKEVVCKTCHTNDVGQTQANPLPPTQTEAFNDISHYVEKNDESPATKKEVIPENNVAVEELVSFIQKDQKANLGKRQAERMDALNHDIAQAIIRETRRHPQYPHLLELVMGIIQAESHFYTTAGSSAGALGIMQIMKRNHPELTRAQLLDPFINARVGITELVGYLNAYHGDVHKALIAYNFGPGNLAKYLAGKKSLPAETRHYLVNVPKYAAEYAAYESTSQTTFNVAAN